MQLCDYSIYYPYRQVVKQSDLCLCISMWSRSVCVLPAVRLSQVTVITECSLYAAWEVNASKRSSGYTWTFQQHTQSIRRKQRMGPNQQGWALQKNPRGNHKPACKQQIKPFIHHVLHMRKKKNLPWSEWLRVVEGEGGRDENISKVMTHHFLPHTQ